MFDVVIAELFVTTKTAVDAALNVRFTVVIRPLLPLIVTPVVALVVCVTVFVVSARFAPKIVPDAPIPPVTTNVPVVVDVDAVPAVIVTAPDAANTAVCTPVPT